MTASNTAFSVFSFLAFVVACIPLPWHLEAWNTGTCLYMGWTATASLIYFVNSIVWKDNAINWAPVYCDISTKIIVGVAAAIPAASLCINRRLYCIAAVRTVTRTRAEKRRAIMIDLGIGIGIPIIAMALHYIVQGHRFNIYEEIGCYPYTYNTYPAFFLVSAIPLIIGLVSGTYSIMSILAFRRRQTEFKEILSSNSNLNSGRYFRLMALAGIEVVCCVPLSIASIALNAIDGDIQPWISWDDTHLGFSRVDQIPSLLWRAVPRLKNSLEMSRWLVVVCSFTFFAFFGFADEAQKHYKLAFTSVAKRVGYTSTGSTKVGSGSTSSTGFGKFKVGSKVTNQSLPIYVSQSTVEKRDSLDTMSDLTSVKDVSDTGSDVGSKPPSPFNTLTKSDITRIPPAALAPNTTQKQTSDRPPSFPSSVTPSGSFLDLSVTKNDEKV